jgi:hypothetical protein
MNHDNHYRPKKYFTAKRLIFVTNILICCFRPLDAFTATVEFTDTGIFRDGKNITDLVDYVSYSMGSERDKMYIIKKIDRQDPETMKKVRFFYNNQNHREVIDVLLKSAIECAINVPRYTTEYLQKAQTLVNKGASANSHNLLTKSLCRDYQTTQFLIKHGAKLTGKNNEDLISRCLYKNDTDNLRYIAKHGQFKLTENDNKIFNSRINQGEIKDEVINVLLDNNAVINGQGFYGLILHEYPITTVRRALALDKTLAVTPAYIKTYETSFKNPHGEWISSLFYPLSAALNTTRTAKGERLKLWYIAAQKDCKIAPQCVQVVRDYKDRIQLLLDHGAIPRDRTEKSIIKKLDLITISR